jgi:2'-5' RNA ligase
MRAFIGIDFTPKMKKEIAELQKNLRKYALKGRWKYVDNFHLTLKFLDEIDFKQKAQIDNVMKNLCSVVKPFRLTLNGLGIFTGHDCIRVLWLGITGEIKELAFLHQEIDKALVTLGFPPEKRKFKPHITIGQDIIFNCGLEEIKDYVEKAEFDILDVNSLFLFKSEQIQNKRIYTKVSEYPLLKK